MKKSKKSKYLFYYLVFCIYFFVTLPFLILASLLLKLLILKKWLILLIEWHTTKLEIWYEFIELYKTTGKEYRPEEYRYEIYIDKRDKAMQEKENYIVAPFPFINDRTILYYEPFDCPVLKKHILKYIKSLNASLGVKNQKLFFWPAILPSYKKRFFRI